MPARKQAGMRCNNKNKHWNVSGKIMRYVVSGVCVCVFSPNKANQLDKSGSALALHQVLSIEITTLTQPPIIMAKNTEKKRFCITTLNYLLKYLGQKMSSIFIMSFTFFFCLCCRYVERREREKEEEIEVIPFGLGSNEKIQHNTIQENNKRKHHFYKVWMRWNMKIDMEVC